MRHFSVHMAADGDAELVKDGFSWPALLFGPLWLAWRGMWRELAALIGLYVVIGMISGSSPQLAMWLHVLVALLLGFEGNSLARAALERKGYEERGVISAQGRDEAGLRLAQAMVAEQAELSGQA